MDDEWWCYSCGPVAVALMGGFDGRHPVCPDCGEDLERREDEDGEDFLDVRDTYSAGRTPEQARAAFIRDRQRRGV